MGIHKDELVTKSKRSTHLHFCVYSKQLIVRITALKMSYADPPSHNRTNNEGPGIHLFISSSSSSSEAPDLSRCCCLSQSCLRMRRRQRRTSCRPRCHRCCRCHQKRSSRSRCCLTMNHWRSHLKHCCCHSSLSTCSRGGVQIKKEFCWFGLGLYLLECHLQTRSTALILDHFYSFSMTEIYFMLSNKREFPNTNADLLT